MHNTATPLQQKETKRDVALRYCRVYDIVKLHSQGIIIPKIVKLSGIPYHEVKRIIDDYVEVDAIRYVTAKGYIIHEQPRNT